MTPPLCLVLEKNPHSTLQDPSLLLLNPSVMGDVGNLFNLNPGKWQVLKKHLSCFTTKTNHSPMMKFLTDLFVETTK